MSDKESVTVNLSKAHLVASLLFLAGGLIVWPTIFYVRVSAAIDRFEQADVAHEAKLTVHETKLSELDRSSISSTSKLDAERTAVDAERTAVLLLGKTDTDHEARIRVIEKTIDDMAADLRWLVQQQKSGK